MSASILGRIFTFTAVADFICHDGKYGWQGPPGIFFDAGVRIEDRVFLPITAIPINFNSGPSLRSAAFTALFCYSA
ncbi:hypothetical protein SAMN05216387_1051 [Nitrosovibrio tenuis]|uniref:Uncharacterized protein n=1 Tax=Nitrosovibrio tenuis TaxID=1233 RepID=A0A1H7MAW5_9PROT|nr:hypothetical protein SAMN05216387_1051 [Nitrosovibrio tenuis]